HPGRRRNECFRGVGWMVRRRHTMSSSIRVDSRKMIEAARGYGNVIALGVFNRQPRPAAYPAYTRDRHRCQAGQLLDVPALVLPGGKTQLIDIAASQRSGLHQRPI